MREEHGMKRFPRCVTGAVVLFAVIGFALPATAAVVTATYRGNVSSGTDDVGLFGVAGASLAGLAFSSIQTFDASLGSSGDFYSSGFEAHQLLRASRGATLTIHGQSFSFSGDSFSLMPELYPDGSIRALGRHA
jgi:hypothetical protein